MGKRSLIVQTILGVLMKIVPNISLEVVAGDWTLNANACGSTSVVVIFICMKTILGHSIRASENPDLHQDGIGKNYEIHKVSLADTSNFSCQTLQRSTL